MRKKKPGKVIHEESTTVVVVSLIGDLLVASTKAGAAVFTGSAAMASEAIHSFVDATNEILLLYGIRQAKRPPDDEHPIGYGREIYFWSFMVALLIFSWGACFSFYQGVQHIRHPHPIETPIVNYIVLAFSLLFDGASWVYAFRQFRRLKGPLGFIKAFELSKDPPSFMTLVEDSAAVIGVIIAALGIFLSVQTGRAEYDGAASICIGAMLGLMSLFLARESKSLLIGEQGYRKVRESILHAANSEPDIEQANGVITVQLAPEQIVAMLSVEFKDDLRTAAIEKQVAALEERVCRENPQVTALFVKPQTAERYAKLRGLPLGNRKN